MNTFSLSYCRSLVRGSQLFISLLSVVIFFTSCNSEVLFDDNFGKTPVGSTPLVNQQIGTASITGDPNSVIIVASPLRLDGNWAQVNRVNNQSDLPGITCTLSKLVPAGEFTFTATLFILANTGLVTISFRQKNVQTPDILHLDFTQDNRVRINDDDATKFGSFPREKDFTISVTLNTATLKARISLSGIGTSGDTVYSVAPFNSGDNNSFNAVRLWIGYPWVGLFDVNGIIITHRTS